jgi:hypothetical protein
MEINEHDIRSAFDGEGTLSPHTNSVHTVWVIQIANTDLHWLELLQEYLIQQGYHPKIRQTTHPDKPKWKDIYKLTIERVGEMTRFLTDFPPLIAHKQRRAAEFKLWLHSPQRKRWGGRHPGSVKAVEQMLKNSRRMM